jgi:hypothetical protein
MGQCPCPHCLVEKDQIAFMGTKLDMKRRRDKARQDSEARQQHVDRARKRIYEFGDRVNAKRFEDLFGPTSAVPNRVRIMTLRHITIITSFQNAFSQRLFQHGFDFYKMFVPDLMHEFELGVWKSIFTHLMRILYANGGTSIQILNERCSTSFSQIFSILTMKVRYRQVPTFGHDTIRVFNSNASAMKKLAARDFEDLLQVRIQVSSRSLLTAKLVRYPCLRGDTAITPQRSRQRSPICPRDMARICQTSPSYGTHARDV